MDGRSWVIDVVLQRAKKLVHASPKTSRRAARLSYLQLVEWERRCSGSGPQCLPLGKPDSDGRQTREVAQCHGQSSTVLLEGLLVRHGGFPRPGGYESLASLSRHIPWTLVIASLVEALPEYSHTEMDACDTIPITGYMVGGVEDGEILGGGFAGVALTDGSPAVP